MTIKCYGLAELLGLVTDLTARYNDGWTHYQVSAKAGGVFLVLSLALLPLLFLFGLTITHLLDRLGRPALGRRLIRAGTGVLLGYSLLLALGIGPYFQFYPQSSGFFSFETLEHILAGLYCAILAAAFFLGGHVGVFCPIHCTKRTEKR